MIIEIKIMQICSFDNGNFTVTYPHTSGCDYCRPAQQDTESCPLREPHQNGASYSDEGKQEVNFRHWPLTCAVRNRTPRWIHQSVDHEILMAVSIKAPLDLNVLRPRAALSDVTEIGTHLSDNYLTHLCHEK